MLLLNVDKVSKNFGYGDLFTDVSFSLNEGQSISIVGPNGCGKSTLLKIIAGVINADTGNINIKKGARVAYLDQTGSSLSDDRKVYDILKESFSKIIKIEHEIIAIQKTMETLEHNSTKYTSLVNRYCQLIDAYTEAGGYEVDASINAVINGLELGENILDKPFHLLSGGEKTLVQLAKVLIIKPDLLLLDEPTNHLDIQKIEWLENYIKSFHGASVIVSHDRYFLDKMANKILDLESINGVIYNKNYSGFIEEKQHNYEKQLTEYKSQQDFIKKLEQEKKYFAQRGMATNSSTLTARAHALQTRIDKLKQSATAKPKEVKKSHIDFISAEKNSDKVIAIKDYSVKLPNNLELIKNGNLTISSHEHIALIGANGSGKSTLIKSILGLCDLQIEGKISIGPSVKIGYLPQIIIFPNDKQKLLDYFMNAASVDEQKARFILAGFDFYQEDIQKRVGNLSGGERMKIKLAELLQNKVNTLILDEPTNHIDIPTKEIFEHALKTFNGTLLFVSHDRYFINMFADKVVEFANNQMTTYAGNYDYYKEKKEKIVYTNR